MKLFLYILLAIVILLMMITIHEFGHYVAGKIFKFKINEFAIGFGPKLFSKKRKNGEVFSIRAFPLGGFCAFEGEEQESEDPSVRSFVQEKPWKRIIVFISGALFNFLSAIIFSFIFVLVIGFATPTVSIIYENAEGVPYNSQIQVGDEIVAVDGKNISATKSFTDLIAGLKTGDSTVLTVVRDGKTIDVTLKKQHIVSSYYDEVKDEVVKIDYEGLGITSQSAYKKVGFGYALKYSVPFTLKMSWAILGSFGQLITGSIPVTSMTGPIGTIGMMADLAMTNWRNILILLPLIASNLAIFNLLPIPALDGSKVVFTVIEWIRGKPVNRNVEYWIHAIGLILLFGLVIIIDILHFAL